jgi:hypothetical protein
VVKGAQEKDGLLPEVARVTELRGKGKSGAPSGRLGLLHVKWHRVDEVNAVAELREPHRIGSGPADIEHRGRRVGQESLQQLLRPRELHPRRSSAAQAIAFVAGLVVSAHRLVVTTAR